MDRRKAGPFSLGSRSLVLSADREDVVLNPSILNRDHLPDCLQLTQPFIFFGAGSELWCGNKIFVLRSDYLSFVEAVLHFFAVDYYAAVFD
jgi:hypothetical protein